MNAPSSIPNPRLRKLLPARAILGAVSILALTACASTGTANPLDEDGRRSNEIEVIVQNQDFNQVTVYTARGASYKRLGIVQGKSEGTFKTDWHYPDIQLRVKFLSGPDLITSRQGVTPGETLELIIPVHR
ncbi:MAG: hypothetical protein ACR2QM_05545 [Longimicrobiales bacterium]